MSTASHTPGKHHHAHHFDSAEHEYSSAKQGVWVFLCTEVLMFGGLFVGYAIFHGIYPHAFHEGAKLLDWRMGALNTVVLLTSSLTMALGIHYIQKGRINTAIWNLIATIACGAIFMVVKFFEYSHKIHEGILPSKFWHYEHLEHADKVPLFFGFYFSMTGVHGAHVLIGMGLITWVALRAKRGEFGPDHWTAVEGVGLFWHLVDLIWIYLFPMFYLVG